MQRQVLEGIVHHRRKRFEHQAPSLEFEVNGKTQVAGLKHPPDNIRQVAASHQAIGMKHPQVQRRTFFPIFDHQLDSGLCRFKGVIVLIPLRLPLTKMIPVSTGVLMDGHNVCCGDFFDGKILSGNQLRTRFQRGSRQPPFKKSQTLPHAGGQITQTVRFAEPRRPQALPTPGTPRSPRWGPRYGG